jgi:uncharacterized C2H2 Zn-finger protein
MTPSTPTFAAPETRLPTCPRCRDVQEREHYIRGVEDGGSTLVCPTCGRQFRPTDPFSVFRDVYDVLSMHRRGVHVDRMAAALLRYEQGVRELVGITEEASRALFLNTENRTLVAVRFDSHGVSSSIDDTLARGIDDAGSWVTEGRHELLWVHPRYDRR